MPDQSAFDSSSSQAANNPDHDLARYRELAESIQDGLFELDRDWRFQYVNKRAAHNVGKLPEELVGQNLWETFPQIIGTTHEEKYRQVMEQRRPVDFEVPGVMANRWYTVRVNPSSQGISIFWIDITEQKQAQEAIFKSREDYRSLVESLEMLIVKVDRDGRYLFANKLAGTRQGMPAAELIGKTIYDTLPAPLAEMQLSKVRQVIDSGQSMTEEMEMFFLDGQTRWGRGRIEPVFDIEGKAVQAIITSIDLSEIKQAQVQLEANAAQLQAMNQSLEKVMRAKDNFLAAMSHELRTPLAGILSSVENLLESVYGDLTWKQAQAVQRIDRSGQRLLTLVNNVLDYTLLQTGQTALQISRFSPGAICQEGLGSIEAAAAAKKQSIAYSIQPEQLQVHGDERRLLQAISCLLDNAVKFTPQGGCIELRVFGEPENSQVKFSVSDSGIGIAPEDLPRLFQPFDQLDTRLARSFEGAGLGLAIARALVELHGGRIDVQSTPGQGSCFTIVLPWETPE